MSTLKKIFVIATCAGLACGEPTASPGTGELYLDIEVAGASLAQVVSGRVYLDGPTDRTVDIAPGETKTIAGLLPGTYTVSLEGYDAGGLVEVFGRQSSVQVSAGQNSNVTISTDSFIPVLNAPPATTTDTAQAVTYRSLTGAAAYEVEWDTAQSFTDPRAKQVSENSAQLSLIRGTGVYYVRVRARSEYGNWGHWSEAESFELLPYIPNVEGTYDVTYSFTSSGVVDTIFSCSGTIDITSQTEGTITAGDYTILPVTGCRAESGSLTGSIAEGGLIGIDSVYEGASGLDDFNGQVLNNDIPDAFGRSNQPFQASEWPYYDSRGWWRWGTGIGDGAGWGVAETDPRLPALTETLGLHDYDTMYVFQAGALVSEAYNISGHWCCAEPSTRYVITLDRMSLTVFGELDAMQVLLGQIVDEPDQLSVGNNPGGDYTRPADLWNMEDPYPAEPGANPFVLGYVFTDPTGFMVIDVVVSCRDGDGLEVWACDAGSTNQDLSIIAPNQPVSHDFPNYNYLTIWEAFGGGSPNYARPLVRYQLGVDLSPAGDPIRNAYAPFPRASVSRDSQVIHGNTTLTGSVSGDQLSASLTAGITCDFGSKMILGSITVQVEGSRN